MIDPDINNVNLIPESKLTMLEIENISKIKKENKVLKGSIIVLTMVALLILIRNYYEHNKSD